MTRVDNVLKIVENYQQSFDCYAHLWQHDRAEFLKHFLRCGRGLAEEQHKACRDVFPESTPTTDNFKEQVNVLHHLCFFPIWWVCILFAVVFNFTD